MPRYKTPRIIGGIAKLFFSLFILSVCSLLIWRVFISTRVPDSIRPIKKTDELAAAYQTHGENLILRYQEQATITRGDHNYGYFSVSSCVFIPQANQVQIVFRYNNSTIKSLAKDYGLAELPKKSEHLFDVTLVKTTDLTPENDADDLDPTTLHSERIFPTGEPIREETSLYTYYRYVFDGVTIEDVTDAIYVDVYYVGALNYEEKPYGALCIYTWDEEWLDYKLSKEEKKLFS